MMRSSRKSCGGLCLSTSRSASIYSVQPPVAKPARTATRLPYGRPFTIACRAFELRGRAHDKDGRVIVEWFNYATPEFLDLYNDYLIPQFEKTHPKIKIRLNSSPGDTGYEAKLLTLIAGKIAPDIVHVTQANFPMLASKGILLTLNPARRRDERSTSTTTSSR